MFIYINIANRLMIINTQIFQYQQTLEFFMEERNLGKCKILLNYLVFCTTWNRFKFGMSELCNTSILFRNILLCIYHFLLRVE